jgi:hypothetical protein
LASIRVADKREVAAMRTDGATGVLEMGRKPKAAKGADELPAGDDVPTQYNIRLNDDELARRVYDTYTALGLDGANFLRQMLRECLPIYERRAQAVRDRKPPE